MYIYFKSKIFPTEELGRLSIHYFCYGAVSLSLLFQVEQLRRANKIWANDNIHLFKILKIPVKKDSRHYLEELEVSEDESGTDDSGINEDRITNNTEVKSGKGEQYGAACDDSQGDSKEGSSEEGQHKQTALSFLEQLDARIKTSKKESEKLR